MKQVERQQEEQAMGDKKHHHRQKEREVQRGDEWMEKRKDADAQGG